MLDLEDENPSPGYWPSVSDLFITLFIIAIAILAAVFFALLPKNNVASEKAIIVAVGQDLGNIRRPVNELREILGLDPIRPTQTPDEVMSAVEETCDKAGERITKLEKLVKTSAPDRIEELLRQIEELERALEDVKSERDDLQALLKNLTKESGLTVEEIIALTREIDDLRRQLHDQPPNIQFSEQKKDYSFGSGSSSMGPRFVEGLRKNEFKRLADEIVARQAEGRIKVDTLEIIGHTDGRPFSGGGNLDQGLPDVLSGDRRIATLTPGSNNDLGLLRALAVREQWEAFIAEHDEEEILRSIEIRCYSAGQTILPFPEGEPDADDFRQGDDRARRIEMRLTRLKTDEVRPAPDWELEEDEE